VLDTGIARNPDKLNDALPSYMLAGVIYSPNKNLDLNAGYMHGFGCNSCAAQVERQFGVGLTWRF
jgi:long-subunit fatty acid transport protein